MFFILRHCRWTLTLLGRGVDGAGQLGMRLSRLGGHNNIGSIAGHFEGDRLADAPRCPGDEERAASELSERASRVYLR